MSTPTAAARRLLLLGCCTWLCAAAPARTPPVEELVEASGLAAAVADLAGGIPEHASRNQAVDKLSAPAAAQFRTTLATLFAAPRLQARVLATLRGAVSDKEANQYLGFFTSPTGKRLVAMETAATAPNADAAMQEFAARLERQPPPATRVTLVRRLEAAGKTAAFRVAVVNTVSLNMVRGMGQVNPRLRVSEEDLQAMSQRLTSELEQQLEAATLLDTLFTYRDATDVELEAAIAWQVSAGGRAFRMASRKAVLGAVEEAALEAGRTLARLQASKAAPAPAR